MEQDNFIGTGINTSGLDIPLGLGMALAQNPKAMEAFGRMTVAQKDGMIRHIQGAATGGDARRRIENAVGDLAKRE